MTAPGRPAYRQVEKAARISECGQYRYWLGRVWADAPSLVFVMLNPSIADASIDDPTIRRCMGYARREGAGGISVLNLYAYRTKDPKELLTCTDAVGRQNDDYLRLSLASTDGPVVAAWGSWPDRDPDRVAAVLDLVPGVNWRCLGHTKGGAPRHPLYLHRDAPLVPLRAGDQSAPRREDQS